MGLEMPAVGKFSIIRIKIQHNTILLKHDRPRCTYENPAFLILTANYDCYVPNVFENSPMSHLLPMKPVLAQLQVN